MAGLRILFVTPDLSSNSLGRTYCLWLLAVQHGWDASVVSLRGAEVWLPLRDSDMARDCRVFDSYGELREFVDRRGFDVVVGIKALPHSALVANRIARAACLPLVIDVDDPDIEAQLSWRRPLKRLVKEIIRPGAQADFRRTRRLVQEAHTIVSNPVLQERYGGDVIPHVRVDRGVEAGKNDSRDIEVAFVGTNRPHKGLSVLRRAVAELRSEGFALVITDGAPADAKSWERWVGTTSIEEGLTIVGRSDVVVVPSRRTPFAVGQLPVKIIDAMMAGTPVIASDIDPIPWELGDAGILVRPGSVGDLKTALRRVADPSVRRDMAEAGRRIALSRYTVASQSAAFASVVQRALLADKTSGREAR